MSSDDSVPLEVVEKMRAKYRKEAIAAVQEGPVCLLTSVFEIILLISKHYQLKAAASNQVGRKVPKNCRAS
jgi:hypothetical protein